MPVGQRGVSIVTAETRAHWEGVYSTRSADQVSWHRPHLEVSFELLVRAGLNEQSRVIDIGGGASTLVDDLLDFGVRTVTVVDLSGASLAVARSASASERHESTGWPQTSRRWTRPKAASISGMTGLRFISWSSRRPHAPMCVQRRKPLRPADMRLSAVLPRMGLSAVADFLLFVGTLRKSRRCSASRSRWSSQDAKCIARLRAAHNGLRMPCCARRRSRDVEDQVVRRNCQEEQREKGGLRQRFSAGERVRRPLCRRDRAGARVAPYPLIGLLSCRGSRLAMSRHPHR